MTDINMFYRFGEFSLNPAGRELKKAPRVVEIESRAALTVSGRWQGRFLKTHASTGS